MKRLVIGAMLTVLASAAPAATYVVDIVGDAATTVADDGIEQTFAVPLVVGVGDSIDFHVSFTGGAAIHPPRHPVEMAVALLSATDRQTETTTGSFDLIGARGYAATHYGPVAESDCCIGVYGRFDPTYVRPFGAISFTGLDAVVTLTGQAPDKPGGPVVAPRSYDTALFYLGLNSAGLPEPAVWTSLTLGFAGVGVAARRRARAAS